MLIQKTQKRDSPKGEHFRKKAESIRERIKSAEVKRDRYKTYEKQFIDAGKPIHKEVSEMLTFLERQIAEDRREMERALFHVGRV